MLGKLFLVVHRVKLSTFLWSDWYIIVATMDEISFVLIEKAVIMHCIRYSNIVLFPTQTTQLRAHEFYLWQADYLSHMQVADAPYLPLFEKLLW